jgi:hypothetical protein
MEKVTLKEAWNEVNTFTKGGNMLLYLITLTAVTVYVTTGRGAVSVELAMMSLVLGMIQCLWQGFTTELFVRHLERNKQGDFEIYPNHISTGGWAIYVGKMSLAIMAAVELALCV